MLSDILAAVLWAQLQSRERILAERGRAWGRYLGSLESWAAANGVRLPSVPGHSHQSFHMFYMVLPGLEARTALIDHLKARGIMAVFHYQPLHLSTMGRVFGGKPGDCPVTERVADRLLRLPFYTAMTDEEQGAVIEAVLSFRV